MKRMRPYVLLGLLPAGAALAQVAAPAELSSLPPGGRAAHGEASSEPRWSEPSLEPVLPNDNRAPAGLLRNGVLTLGLEVRTGVWRPQSDDGPGLVIQAFGEAGGPLRNPGPTIRVPEGTEIRVLLRNTLADDTVTVHGLYARPGVDEEGVRVAPGQSREVRFRTGAPGTYYYWASTKGGALEDREEPEDQLAGALVVDPAGTTPSEGTRERIFVLGMWIQPATDPRGQAREVMVINGKSWPHTERLRMTQGDTLRWRWINPTVSSHPMHLHGFYFRVDSRGDLREDTVYAPGARRLAVTELMLPGGTLAGAWVPERPGNWLFHCHFAFHISHLLHLAPGADAEASATTVPVASKGPAASLVGGASTGAEHAGKDHGLHGMAGLVLGIQVEPAPGYRPPPPAERRRLRLLVQEDPDRFGDRPGYGYLLSTGEAEPPSDSVQIPGPTLVLARGEPVAITIVNRLRESTAVHWHGIELDSYADGVPGWSGAPGRLLAPIAPGDSFTAEFTPPRAGTFIYHSHANEMSQINGGLYGALLVLEPGETWDPARDLVFVVGGRGANLEADAEALVNGHGDHPPITLEAGTAYRFRLINIHSDWRVTFTLASDAGFAEWRPLAKDGAELPIAQATPRPAYLLTGPGETADFEFTPPAPGAYRLEVKTQLAGWHIPVPIRVRGRPPAGPS